MSKFEQVLDGWTEAQAATDAAQQALIAHLDFMPLEPCDLPKAGCDRPAVWVMRMRCCGAIWPACEACRVEYLEWAASLDHLPSQCEKCHRTWNGVSPASEFIPIVGQS